MLGDTPGGENTEEGEGDTARCGGHDGRVSTTFREAWSAAAAVVDISLPADAAAAPAIALASRNW